MSASVADTIRELEERRIRALVDADHDTFEAMCDPRAHYVHSSGKVDTLDAFVGNLRKGVTYSDVSNDILTIVTSDTAALVSTRFRAELKTPTVEKSLDSVAGISYHLIDEEWKVVWMQMTAVQA